MEALAEQLRWDSWLRLHAEVAADVRAPISEIEGRWSYRDMVVHMALRARNARDGEGRCPKCGTLDAGWRTFDGRLAPLPDYLLERSECVGCKELADQEVEGDERDYTNLRFVSSERDTSPED